MPKKKDSKKPIEAFPFSVHELRWMADKPEVYPKSHDGRRGRRLTKKTWEYLYGAKKEGEK
jgi:hypothetical protein